MGMGNMTSRTLVQGWSFTALRMLSAKDKPELDAVNELIMTAAMDITSAEWAVVLFLDTVKQRLLYRPAGLKKTDKSLEIDLGTGNMGGEGLAGKVAVSGFSMATHDEDPMWGVVKTEASFEHSPGPVKNCMAVPCKTFDGKVAGVLVVTNKIGKPTGFEDSDIKKLELLANSVAALVRQQAAEVIFHALDETDEAEAGLKDMLSDFGTAR
jgi:hypothetical protein